MWKRTSLVVVLVLSAVMTTAVRAQQGSEADLLRRIAEQPADLGRQLDLAKFYTDAKRLEDAEQVLLRVLSVVRAQRLAEMQGVAFAAPPPGGQGPFRVGGGIREPRKLKHVPPVYPADAQAGRVQGMVIIECVIGVDGRISDLKVLRSQPLLDQAAVEAVRQWVFEPTLLNGVPVSVVMTVTVNFSLGGGMPPSDRTSVSPPGRITVSDDDGLGSSRKIHSVDPRYPQIALAARVTGRVVMHVTVSKDGSVSDVKVIRSQPLLDQAALDAVRQWRYVPTLLNNVPVETTRTVTVEFSLQ